MTDQGVVEAGADLIKPTLHVEVLVTATSASTALCKEVGDEVASRLREDYVAVKVAQEISGFNDLQHGDVIGRVEIVDFTGPESPTGFYNLQDVQLDVQAYILNPETDPCRSIDQFNEDEMSQARILILPNTALQDEWNSLVFEDALHARLLRYLVRIVSMMSRPGLNLSTFNWNRLCLLYGPPGSGKSSLCRALAQKLSIRLGNTFASSVLLEINSNAMLSKYFGESGKLIGSMFERICRMAQDQTTLICVVMDEVETIAGSRRKATSGIECSDGLRATNQLLTAFDSLRSLPNVVVLCTSNLIEAIDPAFVDRVDIKQLIPSPSPAAIYNIFRSCLNELVRSDLLDAATDLGRANATNGSGAVKRKFSPSRSSSPIRRRTTRTSGVGDITPSRTASLSSPDTCTLSSTPPTIPTFSEMKVRYSNQPASAALRVWTLAQKCEGFSGRTLRRLPILGLAMYTWGGSCSLLDAVSALEAAVEQELSAAKVTRRDVQMGGGADGE